MPLHLAALTSPLRGLTTIPPSNGLITPPFLAGSPDVYPFGKGNLTPPRLSSSPASTLAAAVQLSRLGVGIGNGINPNVLSAENDPLGGGSGLSGNQPPIVNTGNSGPMCVQPGDWICGQCAFVNWRRRRVCMRCFPFAEGNEVGQSLSDGAALAAKVAAGLDLASPEASASVAAIASLKAKRSGTVSGASVEKSSHNKSHSCTNSAVQLASGVHQLQANVGMSKDVSRPASPVSAPHYLSSFKFDNSYPSNFLGKGTDPGTRQERILNLESEGSANHSQDSTSSHWLTGHSVSQHLLNSAREIWSSSPARPSFSQTEEIDQAKNRKLAPIGTKDSNTDFNRFCSPSHNDTSSFTGFSQSLWFKPELEPVLGTSSVDPVASRAEGFKSQRSDSNIWPSNARASFHSPSIEERKEALEARESIFSPVHHISEP
ncbi:hypothetical protein IE53DRAFT_286429 [Violaceomyces palustris]|uniref:Uncharacterized protein n=1 Tax=Violaceomyces palustris TaxID=1673888 RepID=A0ACD0NM91_9BASI|nr:hypothetical protein IE53DRAFT_286429 [Violaceomyces palustris]